MVADNLEKVTQIRSDLSSSICYL